MRADAARNRGRLLEAAADAFREHGLDVPVAEIARRAGVGPGTLFRHFAAKDDLVAAIIEERMRAMLALAEAGLAVDDPWAGFERFLWQGAEMHAADLALMQALKHRALESPVLEPCRSDLRAAVGRLVARAHGAGVLRTDFAAADVPVLMSAIAGAGEGWRRYLQFVLDGLRTVSRPGRRADGTARTG